MGEAHRCHKAATVEGLRPAGMTASLQSWPTETQPSIIPNLYPLAALPGPQAVRGKLQRTGWEQRLDTQVRVPCPSPPPPAKESRPSRDGGGTPKNSGSLARRIVPYSKRTDYTRMSRTSNYGILFLCSSLLRETVNKSCASALRPVISSLVCNQAFARALPPRCPSWLALPPGGQ